MGGEGLPTPNANASRRAAVVGDRDEMCGCAVPPPENGSDARQTGRHERWVLVNAPAHSTTHTQMLWLAWTGLGTVAVVWAQGERMPEPDDGSTGSSTTVNHYESLAACPLPPALPETHPCGGERSTGGAREAPPGTGELAGLPPKAGALYDRFGRVTIR